MANFALGCLCWFSYLMAFMLLGAVTSFSQESFSLRTLCNLDCECFAPENDTFASSFQHWRINLLALDVLGLYDSKVSANSLNPGLSGKPHTLVICISKHSHKNHSISSYFSWLSPAFLYFKISWEFFLFY